MPVSYAWKILKLVKNIKVLKYHSTFDRVTCFHFYLRILLILNLKVSIKCDKIVNKV